MKENIACGALLKQINDELAKNANNAMRSFDITMTQCSVLLALQEAPDQQISMKDLEKTLHVAQSTAAGVAVRLEQKGLVESFGSPEDRRVKLVRLTPAGLERCREARENMDQVEQHILSGLTESERLQLLRLLQKVRDSL